MSKPSGRQREKARRDRRAEALHAAASLAPLVLPAIPHCRCFEARVRAAEPGAAIGATCSLTRRAQALLAAAGEPAEREWFCAVTNVGWERHVREQMQARGLDTVLPVLHFWRLHRRTKKPVESPLLPRYVFFGVDAGASLFKPGYGPIFGLERIVKGASREWATIPAEQIYDLRFRIMRGEFDPTLGHLSPIVRWLVTHGQVATDVCRTSEQVKRQGLQISLAA